MSPSDDSPPPLQIDPTQLSAGALDGLIEEFVTREGTDYGAVEQSLDSKKRSVRRQLERGDIVIVFDVASESCNIVPRELLR